MKTKHWMVLLAMCGLYITGFGLLTNIAGLFFDPAALSFGIGKGSVSLTLTITNLAFAAAGIPSARLLSERTYRPMLIVSTLFAAGCTALLGAAPNIFVMYILSIIRGFFAGCLGPVFVTMVIGHWFRKRTAFITSIVMGCSGISAAILSPLLSSVIESSGWRQGYVVVGILMAACNLPAILLPIAYTPRRAGTAPYGAGPAAAEGEDAADAGTDIRTEQKAAGAGGNAALLLSVYAFLCCWLTTMPQHIPGLANSVGLGAAAGAAILSACMVTNTAGKMVLGVLIDRFGVKKPLYLYCLLVGAAALMLAFFKTQLPLTAGGAVFGFIFSLPSLGASMLTRGAVGERRYKEVYARVNLAATIANALAATVIGYMYDLSGSYRPALFMMTAMILAAGVTVYFIRLRKPDSV